MTDAELRAEWATIDRTNVKHLRRWFLKHKLLAASDHAQIMKCDVRKVYRLKSLAGLATKSLNIPKTIQLPTVPSETPPENWRHDIPWLTKAINAYGVKGVARLVNRDKHIVKDIVKRRGIPIPQTRPEKNPCCNAEWVYRHYVTLKLSQRKCAELAGIKRHTFIRWLTKFSIPAHYALRDARWVNILMTKLQNEPVVKHVAAKDNHLEVRYKSQKREKYFFKNAPSRLYYRQFSVNAANSRITKVPLVHYEFGTDVNGIPYYPAHISLSKTDLNKSSIIEQRLAIHSFAEVIMNRGWIQPQFPSDVVEYDFERLKSIDHSKYRNDDGFTVYVRNHGQGPAGIRTMLNFFDCSSLHKTLTRRKILLRLLDNLREEKYKFNFLNLLLLLAKNKIDWLPYQKRKQFLVEPLHRPALYVAMFKHLNITGHVLDLQLGLGTRAVACAASGLKYSTLDHEAFTHAIRNGFGEFSGINYVPYNGENVDVVICDDRAPNMELVMEYLNKTKTLFVVTTVARRDEMMRYKPRLAIGLKRHNYSKRSGYIFVW